MRYTLTLRLLGTEVLALGISSPAPPAPRVITADAPERDAVVQDCSERSGGGDVEDDPAIPFGFATDVLASPSTVLQPEWDEEEDTCPSPLPRTGF